MAASSSDLPSREKVVWRQLVSEIDLCLCSFSNRSFLYRNRPGNIPIRQLYKVLSNLCTRVYTCIMVIRPKLLSKLQVQLTGRQKYKKAEQSSITSAEVSAFSRFSRLLRTSISSRTRTTATCCTSQYLSGIGAVKLRKNLLKP
ncbi:unnamed protein product [Albugo candida]|uniref:Uncharacterized protein n=1 Tax=Albugo candida TaxID=65357 RepID=A0A024GBP0_9STRA|nr:unnamed protein product [Albugo candida]|eukprot:CCI44084.1 unnamed protein product [Albugo candida]